jgi:hypothetical protein
LRIKAPLEEAMARYGRWIGRPEVEPPRLVGDREAIDLALENDEWRGLAVYIYASGDSTVFEEISGGLGARSADEWLKLADGGDLVYASFNDAIACGEMVCVGGGRLLRHFVQDEQDPSADTNVGKLPDEDDHPIAAWTDVAFWMESNEDELFPGADKGWLWIHQSTW